MSQVDVAMEDRASTPVQRALDKAATGVKAFRRHLRVKNELLRQCLAEFLGEYILIVSVRELAEINRRHISKVVNLIKRLEDAQSKRQEMLEHQQRDILKQIDEEGPKGQKLLEDAYKQEMDHVPLDHSLLEPEEEQVTEGSLTSEPHSIYGSAPLPQEAGFRQGGGVSSHSPSRAIPAATSWLLGNTEQDFTTVL